MKLIDNAPQAWRLFSVWCGSFAVTWGLLPADQQSAILDLFGIAQERVPAILGIVFIVSRLIKQDLTEGK